MPLSENQLRFFTCYGVAFVAFGFVAKAYLWPAIRDRSPAEALPLLLVYATIRVNGLMFLMPGLVSTALPRTFAVPTAYGDLTAAILALLALWPLRAGHRAALPLVWLFNVVGSVDLLYANYVVLRDHVDPTWLGASYYLAAINVPVMVNVHIAIFAYLLRRPRVRRSAVPPTPGRREFVHS